MTAKKLSLMAVLTASALIIFFIEAQIPLPIPVPGVKLGLANAVTLLALFWGQKNRPFVHEQQSSFSAQSLTIVNIFTILLCRIILGAIFTGRPIAFVFSLAGGLLGFTAQAVMRRYVTDKQIWVCGAVGGVFHNVGQILAAILITGTPSIAAYLPVLIIAGIITGIISGLIAQLTLARIAKNR